MPNALCIIHGGADGARGGWKSQLLVAGEFSGVTFKGLLQKLPRMSKLVKENAPEMRSLKHSDTVAMPLHSISYSIELSRDWIRNSIENYFMVSK